MQDLFTGQFCPKDCDRPAPERPAAKLPSFESTVKGARLVPSAYRLNDLYNAFPSGALPAVTRVEFPDGRHWLVVKCIETELPDHKKTHPGAGGRVYHATHMDDVRIVLDAWACRVPGNNPGWPLRARDMSGISAAWKAIVIVPDGHKGWEP